jgi:hypothetical protein
MARKQVSSKKVLTPRTAATKAAKKPDSAKIAQKKTTAKGPAKAKKVAPSQKPSVKNPAVPVKKAVAKKAVTVKAIGPAKSRLGAKTLAASKRLVVAHVGVGDRITEIVQNWANSPGEPASDAILSSLWSENGNDSPFTVGAQDLTRQLNNELGSKLRPTDITTSTSLSDLIQIIV